MGRDCPSERGQRLEHGRLRGELRRRRGVGRTRPAVAQRVRGEALCAGRDARPGTRWDSAGGADLELYCPSGKSSIRNSRAARSPASASALSRPRSSTRRILPEAVFGSVGELDAAHALVGREPPAHVSEDRGRRRRVRLEAGREHDIGLRRRVAHRVGRRHDGGFRHRLVLDQRAFELERAQAGSRSI